MWLLILLSLLLIFYPFSLNHFFSPAHPDPLFLFAHSSPTHLLTNFLSIFIIYLLSKKLHLNERRLFIVFFVTSFSTLFISLLFDLPVLGSSVGVYGMAGFILPELSLLVPVWLSYSILFLSILLTPSSSLPWDKLFHVFGLTFGLVLRYFRDYRSILYISRLKDMGYDRYAIIGIGYYPRSYVVEYQRQ